MRYYYRVFGYALAQFTIAFFVAGLVSAEFRTILSAALVGFGMAVSSILLASGHKTSAEEKR